MSEPQKAPDDISNEISEILISLSKQINAYDYIRIKEAYNSHIGLPELSFVQRQICHCIIMGFHLSAFTLTNHLLEKATKIMLIYNDSLKDKITGEKFELIKSLAKSTMNYDKENLYDNIESLKKENLIDDNEKDRLHFMRDNYRNALSHADRRKLYGESTVAIQEIIGTENAKKVMDGKIDEFPKEDFEYYNVPMADFLFIKNLSEAKSVEYFVELDTIIKNIFSKIKKKSS